MIERTGRDDYLMQCLVESGEPYLPPEWDQKSPFTKAIAKVQRISLEENYVLVNGFKQCIKDFGNVGIVKVIEVYPYEFLSAYNNNTGDEVSISRTDINTKTKAKLYLRQRGYSSDMLKGKSEKELFDMIKQIENE